MRFVLSITLICLSGCLENALEKRDAPPTPQDMETSFFDAAVDGPVDAVPDAMVDAPPDAFVPDSPPVDAPVDAAPIVVQFDLTGDTSILEGEQAMYSIGYSGGTIPQGTTISVAVATTDITTTAADYMPVSFRLNFNSLTPNPSTVPVQIIDDALVEGSEQYLFTISDIMVTPTGTASGTFGNTTVNTTITDND